MRISTNMIYDIGTRGVQSQTADLLKIQQQMSTGRRVLTPSDDPIAASRVLDVSQSQSTTEQFTRNGQSATDSLGLQDSILDSVNTLLQNVRVLAVNAGNPGLSSADRKSLASELQSDYNQLLGFANTTDGNGQYIFSGFKGNTQAFSETTPGSVAYNGDQGQRQIQISASRQVPVSSSGAQVFQQILNGNGTFVTAQAMAGSVATNTGTGVISPGVVLNPAAWNNPANSQDFTIKFNVDTTQVPSVTTYDIVDNVSGNSLLTGAASGAGPYPRTYTSGSTISLKTVSPPDTNPTPFDFGAELSISGDPATGDTFTVKASTNQDIFTTLNDLITSLTTSHYSNAAITNNNNTALSNIASAEENILKIRASVGASMKEVDTQSSVNDDLVLQYQTTRSNLQDLDYTKAISDMTMKQTALEAAQKSFIKVQGLSLFNYIS
ncbi:flagellar hook-associated protein 3 FlgL [Novimethylophilus kurashikiensis]|uniref:Flagellar hook-associated protein 3 FlgL n=1 Tax=Novimethylophilus kurashikiensis TaxID=1825523 RepID=A0A2R5FEM6_9PROT|nr:flagellar hook-associated protein FlgL [Novimethylophilus kurashikiensis]GBG15818.1 flagellar hook-associated protein 3 FlgL [Novimethylophilus kurashikiensis]